MRNVAGDSEANGRKRPLEEQPSFFSWFSADSGQLEEPGEIVRDDIWPNPLQFFLDCSVRHSYEVISRVPVYYLADTDDYACYCVQNSAALNETFEDEDEDEEDDEEEDGLEEEEEEEEDPVRN